MTANTKMDWRALLTLGVTDLRLRPRDFWALTPAELSLMASATFGAPGHVHTALSRGGLDALMQQWPDPPTQTEPHQDSDPPAQVSKD